MKKRSLIMVFLLGAFLFTMMLFVRHIITLRFGAGYILDSISFLEVLGYVSAIILPLSYGIFFVALVIVSLVKEVS